MGREIRLTALELNSFRKDYHVKGEHEFDGDQESHTFASPERETGGGIPGITHEPERRETWDYCRGSQRVQ